MVYHRVKLQNYTSEVVDTSKQKTKEALCTDASCTCTITKNNLLQGTAITPAVTAWVSSIGEG